jgi:hypothetical protein
MKDEPMASAPAGMARDRHMDAGGARGEEVQQRGAARVAQQRARSAGEDRGHPATTLDKPRMADGVDAAMNEMQAPGRHATVDGALA